MYINTLGNEVSDVIFYKIKLLITRKKAMPYYRFE